MHRRLEARLDDPEPEHLDVNKDDLEEIQPSAIETNQENVDSHNEPNLDQPPHDWGAG